jgi:hypothetical protein
MKLTATATASRWRPRIDKPSRVPPVRVSKRGWPSAPSWLPTSGRSSGTAGGRGPGAAQSSGLGGQRPRARPACGSCATRLVGSCRKGSGRRRPVKAQHPETVGHKRSHKSDQGTLARPRRGRQRLGQLPGRRRHEVPSALLPQPADCHPRPPVAALGLIEGLSDGLAVWPAWSAGPRRRPRPPPRPGVGGYATTAILSSLIGVVTAVWLVGVLRAGAWAARAHASQPQMPCLAYTVPPTCTAAPEGSSGPGTSQAPSPAPARPSAPGRPGWHPHRHRPVHHSRPARRSRHRLRYPPRPRADRRERQPLRLRCGRW